MDDIYDKVIILYDKTLTIKNYFDNYSLFITDLFTKDIDIIVSSSSFTPMYNDRIKYVIAIDRESDTDMKIENFIGMLNEISDNILELSTPLCSLTNIVKGYQLNTRVEYYGKPIIPLSGMKKYVGPYLFKVLRKENGSIITDISRYLAILNTNPRYGLFPSLM